MVKKELSDCKETRKKENKLRSKQLDLMKQRWDAEKKEKKAHLQLLLSFTNKLK